LEILLNEEDLCKKLDFCKRFFAEKDLWKRSLAKIGPLEKISGCKDLWKSF
jgi:hypothetical protein